MKPSKDVCVEILPGVTAHVGKDVSKKTLDAIRECARAIKKKEVELYERFYSDPIKFYRSRCSYKFPKCMSRAMDQPCTCGERWLGLQDKP